MVINGFAVPNLFSHSMGKVIIIFEEIMANLGLNKDVNLIKYL